MSVHFILVRFISNKYNEAWRFFHIGCYKFNDQRSKFQLGVILYNNLISKEISKIPNPQAKACQLFEEIITSSHIGSPDGQRNLVFCAAYNLGRAYHQGYGINPSLDDALRCFLLAANNGDPNASVSAQTALGYLYSGPEIRDLQKAFQWHSDACGNGSVESQAALGVMYLYGIGVKENRENALFCLSEASARGSIMVSCDSFVSTPECIQTFQYRAMSMACFLYALCLRSGKGVQKDELLASQLFSKSIEWDPLLAARYARLVIAGEL
ncbi:unnamed protein product [Heterobilharzia americana]|nr:unnamed protein product [Heterobilharzia americana]